jgi:hypothetical protein
VIHQSPRAPLRALPASSREVLLVPGFLVGDSSVRLLAGFLQRAGFVTVGSGVTGDVDCSEAIVRRLESLLERRTHDGSRISIVGHSLPYQSPLPAAPSDMQHRTPATTIRAEGNGTC